MDTEVIEAARDYFKKEVSSGEGISSDAVEFDKKGNAKLDDAQMPVFKDSIEWTTSTPQLHAIWTCCKATLDEGVVPANDAGAVFELMSKIGKLEKPGHTGYYNAEIEINYFVGMINVLTSWVSLVSSEEKKFNDSMDTLLGDFIFRLKAYRDIKTREETMANVKPEDVKARGLTLVNDKEYY